ncbi:MAG: outer membrane protein assembly factor BamE [Cytophagales bacterium]|nr:outer membrane protein assembly factor BamE [Cytophagales bacterium]
MFRICYRIFLFTFICTAFGLGLTACSFNPYKAEVVQGNFVSREQVAALQAGMTKTQVRNILGTPLLTDVFHVDRWDYIFTIERSGTTIQPRHLTVYFKGETLARWEGDSMPSETEFVQSLDSGRKVGKIPPLVADEKTLDDFAARENSRAQATDNAVVTPDTSSSPKVSYPPLETP